MIHKLLSLDEILRHPEMLARQPASEITETKIAAAAVVAALSQAEGGAPEPIVGDRVLSAAQAVEMFPVTRRWLFQNDHLSFIKRLSHKKLAISQRGLQRHLGLR